MHADNAHTHAHTHAYVDTPRATRCRRAACAQARRSRRSISDTRPRRPSPRPPPPCRATSAPTPSAGSYHARASGCRPMRTSRTACEEERVTPQRNTRRHTESRRRAARERWRGVGQFARTRSAPQRAPSLARRPTSPSASCPFTERAALQRLIDAVGQPRGEVFACATRNGQPHRATRTAARAL